MANKTDLTAWIDAATRNAAVAALEWKHDHEDDEDGSSVRADYIDATVSAEFGVRAFRPAMNADALTLADEDLLLIAWQSAYWQHVARLANVEVKL